MGRWRERWIEWRNRRLGSPDFQRWASRFPPTRGIARARARGLFDLVAGFVYSQVAVACVETRLLPFLAGGRRSVAEVAAHIDLPPAAALRLLKAAAALQLAEAVGGAFMLGPQGAALLGNPGVLEMIAHHRALYADLADPVALLRGGRRQGALAAYWPYADASASQVASYSALMAASQPMLADQILDAYPIGRHRRLLDIGGGEGVFLRAVERRAPKVEATLFDLPAVADRARSRGLDAIGGSFIDGPLPGGADLMSLIRVLHDHDDEIVHGVLRKVHRALPAGGTLLIAEPMAGTADAEPVGDAYFGFYLLAMGSGRPRSASELTEMLHAAGFRAVRERHTRIPALVRVLIARA